MVRTIAGISPEGIGWARVKIAPQLMDIPDLEGTAATPKGAISFRYRRADSKWTYSLRLPENLSGNFFFPDGRTQHLNGGMAYELSWKFPLGSIQRGISN